MSSAALPNRLARGHFIVASKSCLLPMLLAAAVGLAFASPGMAQVWRSYNATLRDDGTDPSKVDAVGLIRGDIVGSNGSITQLEFFASNYTVNPGRIWAGGATSEALTTQANTQVVSTGNYHSNHAAGAGLLGAYGGGGINSVAPFWVIARGDGTVNQIYVTKSTIARGSDTGEGNPSAPNADVDQFDLELHSRFSSNGLTVVSWIAPTTAVYDVSEIALRRTKSDNPGETGDISLMVYDQFFNPITGSLVTVDHQTDPLQDWKVNPGIFTVSLAAGERLYFAVQNSDFVTLNNWNYDNAEINFTISQTPEPAALTLWASLGIGAVLVIVVRRRAACISRSL